MFQDIEPHIYNSDYFNKMPDENDYIVVLKNNKVLTCDKALPVYSVIVENFPVKTENFIYLFSVDNSSFFYLDEEFTEINNLIWESAQIFRQLETGWLSFGCATAYHLAHWYNNNSYCGKCGKNLEHKSDERALSCPDCGLVTYPKISPAIIVGIIDKDKLLLTKYSNAEYKKYALIAGFMEIGETLEDTVKREVMEEVGLKVKNIRYYKNQPWAFSQSILVGFFADLDGCSEVTLDTNELSEATWFDKAEIPDYESRFSLTWDMIEAFRNGEI